MVPCLFGLATSSAVIDGFLGPGVRSCNDGLLSIVIDGLDFGLGSCRASPSFAVGAISFVGVSTVLVCCTISPLVLLLPSTSASICAGSSTLDSGILVSATTGGICSVSDGLALLASFIAATSRLSCSNSVNSASVAA